MGKRVLGCSFIENFSSHFCGELIIPVHKSSGILGVCAYHCLPHAPDPKGELLVSLPGQVSVAISQSSKEFAFSCKVWQSSCDTSNTKKPPAFQEKANHLEGATPLRKQGREHILLCIQFTLRHITSQVPPVCHSSQNSARPPTHFLAKWLTQKSSREAAATAGRKKQGQLAKQHRVGRSHSLGTKRVGYGLPWNERCNGGWTTEVMRRKDREERTHQGKELSTSTAVNSPKFLPSSWFPNFQK